MEYIYVCVSVCKFVFMVNAVACVHSLFTNCKISKL